MARFAPNGPCRLCLEEGKLTYEHVPPEAAGNNQKVISSAFEEWFRPTKWTGKGKQSQRGSGEHVLCGDCNNRVTGQWYVPEYVLWADAGLRLLQQASTDVDAAEIELDGTHPLRFIKQVVAMFFSVNTIEFSRGYRDLAEFVLNRDKTGLPPGFEIYLALIRGNRARSIGVSGVINGSTTHLVTEVAFPPFGLLMTIDSKPINDLGRITDLSRYGYNECRDVALKVLIGEVFSPYPGDYRSEERIKQSRSL